MITSEITLFLKSLTQSLIANDGPGVLQHAPYPFQFLSPMRAITLKTEDDQLMAVRMFAQYLAENNIARIEPVDLFIEAESPREYIVVFSWVFVDGTGSNHRVSRARYILRREDILGRFTILLAHHETLSYPDIVTDIAAVAG